MTRTLKFAIVKLIFNMGFSIYHLTLGFVTSSWWLLTLGFYYLTLSAARFLVIRIKSEDEFITKLTGWMMIALSVPLAGTVVLSVVKDRGRKLSLIPMLAVAVYAFTKIILAIVKFVKSRKSNSAKLISLRNISLATASASLFALQRSMLASFDGVPETEAMIMNAALGSAVFAVVLVRGVRLLRKKLPIANETSE